MHRNWVLQNGIVPYEFWSLTTATSYRWQHHWINEPTIYTSHGISRISHGPHFWFCRVPLRDPVPTLQPSLPGCATPPWSCESFSKTSWICWACESRSAHGAAFGPKPTEAKPRPTNSHLWCQTKILVQQLVANPRSESNIPWKTAIKCPKVNMKRQHVSKTNHMVGHLPNIV
jgi:hypothetical protein